MSEPEGRRVPEGRGQFGMGKSWPSCAIGYISTSKIRFLEAEGLIEPAESRSGYRRCSAAPSPGWCTSSPCNGIRTCRCG